MKLRRVSCVFGKEQSMLSVSCVKITYCGAYHQVIPISGYGRGMADKIIIATQFQRMHQNTDPALTVETRRTMNQPARLVIDGIQALTRAGPR